MTGRETLEAIVDDVPGEHGADGHVREAEGKGVYDAGQRLTPEFAAGDQYEGAEGQHFFEGNLPVDEIGTGASDCDLWGVEWRGSAAVERHHGKGGRTLTISVMAVVIARERTSLARKTRSISYTEQLSGNLQAKPTLRARYEGRKTTAARTPR